jgi:4-hydroxy-2-oxoheptanedioate aldolase
VIIHSGTSADAIEGFGPQGIVDGAWIEMEHGPITFADLSDMSRACDLWGITSLVRVNHGEEWLIGRTLDRGIQGVLVPHCSTKEYAQQVVRGTYYTPLGLRGIGGSRQGLGVTDYLKKANDELFVMVLIEEVRAIENLDEILTVDNIDCFFVAPGDLSQTMGPEYLGQMQHPDVQGIVKNAVKKIVAAGKTAGTLVNDDNVEEYLELGARFLLMNTTGYVSSGLNAFQKKVAAKVS